MKPAIPLAALCLSMVLVGCADEGGDTPLIIDRPTSTGGAATGYAGTGSGAAGGSGASGKGGNGAAGGAGGSVAGAAGASGSGGVSGAGGAGASQGGAGGVSGASGASGVGGDAGAAGFAGGGASGSSGAGGSSGSSGQGGAGAGAGGSTAGTGGAGTGGAGAGGAGAGGAGTGGAGGVSGTGGTGGNAGTSGASGKGGAGTGGMAGKGGTAGAGGSAGAQGGTGGGGAGLVELVLEGGFENGSVNTPIGLPWHVLDNPTGGASVGSWFAQNGTMTPASPPNGPESVPQPPGGAFAAMTNQSGPAAHALYQDVTVPDMTGLTATLSFKVFVGNRPGTFSTPATLDPSVLPNQQATVDLVAPLAAVFSVAAADVYLNAFTTPVGSMSVYSAYQLVQVDVTATLTAHQGEKVRLRFVEVDNAGYFQLGIDDVSLLLSP